MGAAPLIAVAGIALFFAPSSYAQHGGHMGGGFSGRGSVSSGHSSGRNGSSPFLTTRGSRHLKVVTIPGFLPRPKPPAAPDRVSPNSQFASRPVTMLRIGRGDTPRPPVWVELPSAPFFLRRPATFNSCFGRPFCSPFLGLNFGFGFGPAFVCDPFFRFGGCFPPFGSTFFDPVLIVPPAVGFAGEFVPSGSEFVNQPADNRSDASDAAGSGSALAQGNESQPDASSSVAAKSDHHITLLQLKIGWMYGLTDYWVEGDNLHYTTNYGAENSVALEQIDFANTIRLNSERGVEFSLHTKRLLPLDSESQRTLDPLAGK
jgi:hypothetical protein